MPYNATPCLPASLRWMRCSVASVVVVLLQALAGLILQAGPVYAEDRRFHIGIEVPVDYLQASWDKTVDNSSSNTLVPEP